MRNLNEDIYTVDEGPADSVLIAGDKSWGAGALTEGVIVVSARTPIHLSSKGIDNTLRQDYIIVPTCITTTE